MVPQEEIYKVTQADINCHLYAEQIHWPTVAKDILWIPALLYLFLNQMRDMTWWTLHSRDETYSPLKTNIKSKGYSHIYIVHEHPQLIMHELDHLYLRLQGTECSQPCQTFKPSMAEMVPVADAKNWLLLLWLPSG